MNPTLLKKILILAFVLVLASGAGLYYLELKSLKELSVEANHATLDAEASVEQSQNLSQLSANLDNQSVLIAKAESLLATTSNYQTRASQDIQKYARLANIGSVNISFDSSLDTSDGKGISVTFDSGGVPYTNFIAFVDAIENNIPKFQISEISVSRSDTSSNLVVIDKLSIIIMTEG